MGYRLDIDMIGERNNICCGKLYGYISDEDIEKSLGINWLIEKDYINNDDKYWIFYYGFEGNFVLRGYELREFLKCYITDLEKLDNGYDNKCLIEEIEKYIETITDDYNKYVLMWG